MAENVDRHLNSVMNLEYTLKSSVSETNGKYFFLTKTIRHTQLTEKKETNEEHPYSRNPRFIWQGTKKKVGAKGLVALAYAPKLKTNLAARCPQPVSKQ
jgi:hypothetical protein